MEEVDKGCSEFCVTVGTVIRTAGLLIHSRLKTLAVHLSRPSSRLWLYAGLVGSNNHHWLKADLVVCVNPSSSQSRRCLRQTVHTHCASVHQAAKLVAAFLRVAWVTVGLAESNGSLPPGL